MNVSISNWIDSLGCTEFCWWCGKKFDSFRHAPQVHHIERRRWCGGRENDRCNLFLVGKQCHDTDLAASDYRLHAATLARKLVYDPDHFNLEDWLRLRDPELTAPERVTWSDIARHLRIKEYQ